jgi:3-mercaptopyruvate sulfurtransferase SseA
MFTKASRVLRLYNGQSRLLWLARMYTSRVRGPLISVSQLKEVVESPVPPVILDCSWFMPNVNRNAANEFQKVRIPGARFFDVDEVRDKFSPYPHMLPSAEGFAKAVGPDPRTFAHSNY